MHETYSLKNPHMTHCLIQNCALAPPLLICPGIILYVPCYI
eukprot:UN08703